VFAGQLRAHSRAPHRTGALAHVTVYILACQAGSGAQGRRMKAAHALCPGATDSARAGSKARNRESARPTHARDSAALGARGASAHGLADIRACQAGSGARGRRMEAAQTTGVAFCGKCDTCHAPGSIQPISEKRASRMGHARSAQTRTATGLKQRRQGNSPLSLPRRQERLRRLLQSFFVCAPEARKRSGFVAASAQSGGGANQRLVAAVHSPFCSHRVSSRPTRKASCSELEAVPRARAVLLSSGGD
jgi:hypothetical protein